MEKTVGAFELRRQCGKILQDVAAKGDRFLVERHGAPIAAIVPVEVYEQWKRERASFFEKVREAQERSNLRPDLADELAEQAVKAARGRREF